MTRDGAILNYIMVGCFGAWRLLVPGQGAVADQQGVPLMMKPIEFARRGGGLAVALGAALVLGGSALAHEAKPTVPAAAAKGGSEHAMPGGAAAGGRHMEGMPGARNLMMPEMDAARGRKLFASKGCVACHAINGVGGHDATPLDAHTMDRMMNPFEFAAKMWTMAPYMITAQEEALGEQITFTGAELADIIAFVHDDKAQHGFSEDDIPPEVMPMMHHSHGAKPGGGAAEHAEELGHPHGAGTMPHGN